MKVNCLGYILVETTDLDKWNEYGQEVCGFMKHPELSNDSTLCLKIDEAPYRFSIQKGSADKYLLAGFELENQQALDDAKTQLQSSDVEFEDLTREVCSERLIEAGISLSDPAGHTLELYINRNEDKEVFVSPQGISGFITKNLGFGHVVYATLNIEETHDFYKDVLGFGDSDITDLKMSPNPEDPPMRLYFMHCDNPRHHSVAMMQAPTPPSGLIHTMVEVENIDDVGKALDRALARDIHISSTLGRHENDGMLSFYMQTPAGFDLEFGYDGKQPDWEQHETTYSDRPSVWGHEFTPPG